MTNFGRRSLQIPTIQMEETSKVRPVIDTIQANPDITIEEQFQNEVIRPIVKMQHDLLIVYFKHYIVSQKCRFEEWSDQKRISFVESAFQKDNRMRNELKGLIIGHFNKDEFLQYSEMSSGLSKRILGIIRQRISSSIQQLMD